MEQLSSPGREAVELKDCIEELVKFTLESHINQTLGFDLGLSKAFCSNLLKEDQDHPNSCSTSAQAPADPFYKLLAQKLYEFIVAGAACGASNKMESSNEDSDMKSKGEWNDVARDEGIGLVNIVKTVNFELHVQEPFFSQLKDGLKTVEGRCAVGDYNRIGPGELILFNKCLVLQVQDVHRYASFSVMLEAESLAKVLPGVQTIDEGVKVYRNFYTEEKERSNGVLAICVAKSAAQPYISLGRILSELGYRGIERIVGLSHQP